MLDELKRLHETLLFALSELERLREEAMPDRGSLADARWKLSRASGQRAKFIDDIVYPYLLERVSPSDGEKLGELRAQNVGLRSTSTEHVRQWTIKHAIEDWAGYRRASSAMTSSMRQRIAAEKATLYPLLEECR